MLNKDLFVKDPTQTKIPNDGVAKVAHPENEHQWSVLEWELRSFVCDGEYERGVERILDSFLTNLGQAQQPAVWVSGFYGSGKSHLCRVLEYLWRDVRLPTGETARGIVSLSSEIDAHLRELSTQGRRHGGLWSAAGTLGAGRSRAVRLAFLSVLYESAGLPEQYPLARFWIWASENGYLPVLQAAVEEKGRSLDDELHDLYVSPIIARALLEADPTLAESVSGVRTLLRDQFPPQNEDITDEQMFDAVEDILRLQADTQGRYPLTLIVLDEMQQYLGDDNERTLAVQNIVEAISSRFENSVLFVATGQSAMGATPTLQKLQDRFPIPVELSDKDVETVVRQVILQKKPDRIGDLSAVLDRTSGEINRHLGGTKIAPVAADENDLIPDYPLLPTRRRFWELALRGLDRAGKAGVLRTQLRIVHEATRDVANEPVGYVVGADFLYFQQAPSLQQSGALLKEISESILTLKADGPDGELKARICALVFLITNIPTQMIGAGEIGLRPTHAYLEDLLVEDLDTDGARLRRRVPELLEELVSDGQLMLVGDEYRLQTEEGAEWEREFQSRVAGIRDDASKLAQLRTERFQKAIEEALGKIRLTQGRSKAPRKLKLHFGDEEPAVDDTDVPVWIRDGWESTEATVKSDAAQAGVESATVYVAIPKRSADAIKEALASRAAAQDTLHSKPTPQTDEGREAQRAIKGRADRFDERLSRLVSDAVAEARVFQGGGSEVTRSTFGDAVQLAGERSLHRLYPRFDVADNPNWSKVITKARDGAPDALTAVGHSGDAPTQPVCREILATISAGGTKGQELDKRFSSPPYGWPQDAVRGAVMALLATGHIRAAQDGIPLTDPRQLEPRQVNRTTFYKEDDPPTASQRMAVRSLLVAAKIPHATGHEQAEIPALLQKLRDLAQDAGGDPPLPERPDTTVVVELQSLAGNQQFKAVADAHLTLKGHFERWQRLAELKVERLQEWQRLEALLHHARDLDGAQEIAGQRDAVHSGRQLLAEPNPLGPPMQSVSKLLREALERAAKGLEAEYEEQIGNVELTEDWQALDSDERGSILRNVGLAPPIAPEASTAEQLLSVLNDNPLRAWPDKIEVLKARAERARLEAAKKRTPETVRFEFPSATLRTEGDVVEYLENAKKALLQHVNADKPVVV